MSPSNPHPDEPRDGFFKRREYSRGPWQPILLYYPCPFVLPVSAFPIDDEADLWFERSLRPRRLEGLCDGKPMKADDIAWGWPFWPITRDEYLFLLAQRARLKEALTTEEPEPKRKRLAVDLSKAPAILPPT